MGILATVGCIRGVGVQFSTGRLGDSPSRQSRQATCLPFCYVHAQESESIALVLTTIFFFLAAAYDLPACLHTYITYIYMQASVRTAKINKLNHYYSGFFSWLRACVCACVRAAPRDRKEREESLSASPSPSPSPSPVLLQHDDEKKLCTVHETQLMNYYPRPRGRREG